MFLEENMMIFYQLHSYKKELIVINQNRDGSQNLRLRKLFAFDKKRSRQKLSIVILNLY